MPEPDTRTLVKGRPSQLKILLVGSYSDDFLNFSSISRGYRVDLILDSAKAVTALVNIDCDIVVTGLNIGPANGMDVLSAVHAADPDVPTIVSTHDTSPRRVVEVMQAGAFDYLVEPYSDFNMIRDVIDRAAARRRTLLASRALSEKIHRPGQVPQLVGASRSIDKLREAVQVAAQAESPVLITGDSGTGKGLIARAIHDNSNRSSAPFVTVNCGAIPEQLMESELFGHVRGAFTGATSNREGRAEQANGGTLFLDELAELSPSAQVKLLRFIEDKAFERVGQSRERSADVRILCATNRNLPSMIASGLFREDLFYRINVLNINMPPLKKHLEDVPLLAQHFLEKMSADSGKKVRAISQKALELLSGYSWPGNARELRNIVERAFVFTNSDTITTRNLPDTLRAETGVATASGEEEGGLRERLRREERRMILQALEAADWIRSQAARDLAIPRPTLIRKMHDLGITNRRP